MTDDEILKKWHENKITFELSPYKKIIAFARALLAAGASEGQAEPSIDWRIRVTETAHKAGFQPDAVSGALICTPAVIENFAREIERHASAEITALRERIAGMEKDAGRLDFLDAINERKNKSYGTKYGWHLTENHNRIALEDHGFPVMTVRQAIDAAIAKEKQG